MLLILGLAAASASERKLWHAASAHRGQTEAALLCYGLRITDRVTELRARYQGADLAEFDLEAGKVLEAWRMARTCERANGPNECKVSQQWNCLQALREIGPEGSAVPGLVEPK